jgi:hypothetical protein
MVLTKGQKTTINGNLKRLGNFRLFNAMEVPEIREAERYLVSAMNNYREAVKKYL